MISIFISGDAGGSRDSLGEVLWDRRGVQRDGDGAAWAKSGGPVQLL